MEFPQQNNGFTSQSAFGGGKTSSITAFLMRNGIVKTEKEASSVLIVLSVVVFVVAVTLFLNSTGAFSAQKRVIPPPGYTIDTTQGPPRLVPSSN